MTPTIEAVIDPDSAAVIQALLRKLHEARCGRTPLPGLEEDEPRERLPYRDSE